MGKHSLVILLFLSLIASNASFIFADLCDGCEEKLNAQTRQYLLDTKDDSEEREYLVQFSDAVDHKDLADVTVSKEYKRFPLAKIKGTAEEIEALLNKQNIAHIEFDQHLTLLTDTVPYGVARTGAPAAWGTADGSGVKVAILDTGITNHSDLVIAGGYSVVSATYEDTNGHGTAVAGIVAAAANDQGIIGVSPDVSLYAIKIMNDSSGSLSDAIAGIEWAIDNDMNVIVMSFGVNSYSVLLRDALEEAYDEGILLIAASGNEGVGTMLYPAAYSSVIAVGAIDQEDTLTSFSSYGMDQELVAVGIDVNTTGISNDYVTVSGTSFAAPHVAGVAALAWSQNPSLTNQEIRGKLRNDAFDLWLSGRDDTYGYGVAHINLTSTNYTLSDDSYQYTISNVTDYGLETQTETFWLSGNGSIDDITFSPGTFLIQIPRQYDRYLSVAQNGTVRLLSSLLFQDSWQGGFDATSNTDGVIWNESHYVKVAISTSNQVGECWFYNYTGSGNPNKCIFKNTSVLNSCINLRCHPSWGCNATTGTMGGYHTFLNGTYPSQTRNIQYKAVGSVQSGCNNNDEAGRAMAVVSEKRFNCSGSNFLFQGRYGPGFLEWTTFAGTQTCGGTNVCDPGLYPPTCAQTSCTPVSTCRAPDGQSCSQDAQCLTNHYCVNNTCQTSLPACTATNGEINVLAEDRTGNPLTNLSVYFNNVFNTTTDSLGAARIKIGNSVSCSANQEIKVTCADNVTVCGIQTTRVSLNGDVDSLSFDCTKCSTNDDLYLSQAHVFVDFADKNVTVTVFSTGVSDTFDVNISRQGESGLIVESKKVTITLIAGGQKNASVKFDNLNRGDFLHVWLDPNDDAPLEDNVNNYLFRPALKPVTAYIDVRDDPAFSSLNEVMEEYLAAFLTRVDDPADADIVLRIGRVAANDPLLNDLRRAPKSLTKPYAAVISSRAIFFGTNPYPTTEISAYGRGVEGTIAAVKRVVNSRAVYFTELGVPQRKQVYLDDFDTLGISVYDQLHSGDAQSYFGQNNAQLQQKVRSILFDNNFEVAVKPVKTHNVTYQYPNGTKYNKSIILRVKHVNSDFSDDYKDAVGISSTPVVFSGGIFSNLEGWESNSIFPFANNGLASQMAEEGWDVWAIEMTGGPETDECEQPLQCPNYKFEDLTNEYWPALLAGVQEYSGQTQVDYVGHSNGCRVALVSLNNYSTSGKNNAGYYFNYVTGAYVLSDLSAIPVRRFVGVACPSILDDVSDLTILSRVNTQNGLAGNVAIIQLSNKEHVTLRDYAAKLIPSIPFTHADQILRFGVIAIGGTPKISRNLMQNYNDLAIDSSDTIDLSDLNVDALYLFGTDPQDIAVPYEDQQSIYDAATMLNSTQKEIIRVGDGGLISAITFNHIFIKQRENITEGIKERLQ